MLFSSTSDFPFCLCLLSFLWLTCFFSCLLNIPGYEHTMRESWPRILQTLKFISWFYSRGVSPQSIKLIRTFLLSIAVRDRGCRNLFTLPILYFPYPLFHHLLPHPVRSQASAYGKDFKRCQELQKPNGFPHPTRLDQTSLLTSVATGYYFTELTNFRWGAVIKRSGMETRSCLLMPQVFTFPPKMNPNITTVAFQPGGWGVTFKLGELGSAVHKRLCVLEYETPPEPRMLSRSWSWPLQSQ